MARTPNNPPPADDAAQDGAAGSTEAAPVIVDAPPAAAVVADDDTAAAYAAVAVLTGEADAEIAAQVALAADSPERLRAATAAGIPVDELFAWKWYADPVRLVVVTVAGQKIQVSA